MTRRCFPDIGNAMSILKKIIIGLFVFFVVLGITGFFIAPPIVKSLAIDKLSATLHRKVSVEKIRINPYALSITVRGFSLEDPDKPKPFVAFDELYLNADLMSSIFRRALILKKITLTHPYVGIARKPDNSYNFSDLLPREEAKPKPAKKEKPFHFSLNNIQMINGSIDFQDDPEKTTHKVREMNISVPFVSNIEYYLKDYVEPKFSAIINDNKYEFTGKTQPFETSRDTTLDLNVQDVDIPFYLNYVPVKLNCQLKSARLDTRMKIHFIVTKDKSRLLALSGNVALKDVLLNDLKNNKILGLPSLSVDMASVEPLVQNIHLAQITLESPELVIRRDKGGQINLLNLTEKQTPKVPAQKDKAAAPGKKPAFKFRVDSVALNKADIVFMDAQPSEPVNIRVSPLDFTASNLSTEEGKRGQIALEGLLNKKSPLKIAGDLALEPLSAKLKLDLKNINIRDFQSYFTDKIKMDVTRGAISITGDFSLAKDKKDTTVMTYNGGVLVSNLVTLDKAQSNDFLKWKKLSLDKIKFVSSPLMLHINSVSLADFFARIIINPDATINVQDIFSNREAQKTDLKEQETKQADKKPEKEKTTPETKQPPADIRIGKVIFSGGNIDFSDKHIKPNYSANMLNLKGSVTGLSSKEFSRADVALKGNLGYGSPIDITGKINPLAKDLFADIKVSFQNIELSPVTPYSSKYLGYPITKGKLTFDVSYLIDKRKLDSENKILIDQLTFGDKVESPDAIKAPVTLAVSLLTDRKGQINLDLPVSGSLDDPKFKIWSVIWQIIVNLITKAVTSPFALLSSLTGGGEELSFIEFEYGSTVVSDDGKKKIALIVKALGDRPNIKLDIEGYVDTDKDKPEVKKTELNRRIKAQKTKETSSKDDQQINVDEVPLTPQEYDKYLKQVYRAAKFDRPRNFIGLLKDIPVPEMEKLMLADIDITESDLRQLAARRAQNVRDLILQSGDIDPGKIFMVKPEKLAPERKDKIKDSRVNFKLK